MDAALNAGVRYLALPCAVLLHTLGALVSQLIITALVSGGATDSLSSTMTAVGVVTALIEVVLCLAALVALVAELRAGRTRIRAWTVARSALAASLLSSGLYALLWYSGLGAALIMERNVNLGVSTLGMVLAGVSLVSGVVAVQTGSRGPGTGAVVLAAIATPAALLAPVVGMIAQASAALTVASYGGAALALVGLAAATVALRRSAPHENPVPDAGPSGPAAASGSPVPGRSTTDVPDASAPAPGVGSAAVPGAAAETERTGRRFLRHLATPLALTCLALILPLMDFAENGQVALLLVVLATALALAAVIGAVLDFRSLAGTAVPRAARLVGELAVPSTVLVVPLAALLGGVMGGGWAFFTALIIGALAAGFVALLGLIGVLVAVFSGHYASGAAKVSMVATSLVFIPAVMFIPFQSAGIVPISLALAGALLLTALVAGVLAVASRRPTLRLPAPTQPLFTEATANPYL
ncbi:hypothetical protein [Citricoccus muralis]|uniref:Uncharacterized protein n=1 Tax=Citricoccus muralis TaxID=169134 RepID=A0A3D9LCB0_9MICC|nr:hypothetical protein [Citricoccus muralis]REE04041.1 hypothetical protein C8E99_1866 [Citricoccus muralis]